MSVWTDWRSGVPTPDIIAGLVNEPLEEMGWRPLGYSVAWFRASPTYDEYLAQLKFYRELQRDAASVLREGDADAATDRL